MTSSEDSSRVSKLSLKMQWPVHIANNKKDMGSWCRQSSCFEENMMITGSHEY